MRNKLLLLLCLSFAFTQANAQLNMSLLSQIEYDTDANDIWGWADPDDGTEYAIVGLKNGVSIVSLADPNNAQEVAFIPGQNSIWRDIKTWGDYAYVVTDQGGTTEGLTVIDLSDLPNSAPFFHWTPEFPGLGQLERCHNIYIDENGYAYLAGCNVNEGGMLFIDVFTTPGSPAFVGPAPNTYSHDVYVRDNKMYAAEIYEGRLAIYNVDDKLNPTFMGSIETPFNFTHNVWLSEDGNIAYTTDEKPNAPVASYDVSNPEEIVELDQFRPLLTLGLDVIPHNVHVWGEDWLVISYYTDGGIIADASRPDNIIEVGNFDTFLGGDGGFSGAWGLYPYLPSGIVLVSDINNGLFVLDAQYVHACWLEGNVTDSQSGAALFDVNVEIVSDELNQAVTDLLGDYKTGIAISGTFDVEFSKPGYYPKTVSVDFENGVLEILDVTLDPFVAYTISGLTITDEDGAPVQGATVIASGEGITQETVSNESGVFELELYQGSYEVYAGAWGYHTIVIDELLIDAENSITLTLEKGYKDDFVLDMGWSATHDDTAETGFWVREVPIGSYLQGGAMVANVEADVNSDLGDMCFMTGNGDGSVGDHDVDGGKVYLTSPVFDLSEYIDPVLSYRLWFVNESGLGEPNDNVSVFINNGTDEVLLEMVNNSVSLWRPETAFHLTEFIDLTDQMTIRFETGDDDPGNILEAAVDAFSITEVGEVVNSVNSIDEDWELSLSPNPFTESINISFSTELSFEKANIEVYNGQGQIIRTLNINQQQTHLSFGQELPSGIYFIKFVVDGKVISGEKIVKS